MQPPKGTIFHGKTSYNAQIFKIGPPVQPVRVTKKPKKDRQRTLTMANWVLPRPPTLSDRDSLAYEGSKIWLVALLWPMAYTTACTTVQALIYKQLCSHTKKTK